MVPVTRSETARIAGFPDATQGPEADRKERRLTTNNDLQPLEEHADNPGAIGSSDVPPTYTIDLSRPPGERYTEVVTDFKNDLAGLTGLFEEVVTDVGLPIKAVTRLARLFLRRLYSKEQTEELRGISKISGVDMYLLVSFNTLLDLFMGCTSGGARVKDGGESKMIHFRTLDWTMDPLRKVVVQLEFVEKPQGPVIARSVTYIGFVGILTGVRKDLSMSLNFRPYHNNDTSKVSNLRFYTHHLLVLLGLRPSISARLRDLLVPSFKRYLFSKRPRPAPPNLEDIKRTLPSEPTTAAYLIFSNGTETTILEKDRATATVRSSTSFITITNHDVTSENRGGPATNHAKLAIAGMQDLIDESGDRRDCIEAQWRRARRRFKRRNRNSTDEEVYVRREDVISWIEEWPITNETTHYATIMDPKTGDIVWVRRWLEQPVEP